MKQTTDTTPSTSTRKRSRASIILCIISTVFLMLTGLIVFLMWDYIREPALLRDAIGEHSMLGALSLILISAVQVIVALVPGEFIEIAAGYMFGGIWGAVLCLVGIVLGSCITILLVRRFGRQFVYVFYPQEKLDALPILKNSAKRNILTFIIFIIPGTPKDLFTYAIGLTDMSIPLYIALTTLARFPSVITSTMTGNAAGKKDYLSAFIFLVVTGVISGIGLLLYRRISRKSAENSSPADTSAHSERRK